MDQIVNESPAQLQAEPATELLPQAADSLRGMLHEQGIALQFGNFMPSLSDSAAATDGTVKVSDRIILSAGAAKRLLIGLERALSTAAPLGGGRPAISEQAAVSPAISRPAMNIASDPAAEQAALLLRHVNELGVPYQQERSFRMAHDELQANRFLITMDRIDLPDPGVETVLAICRELGLPGYFESAVRQHFDKALCVHLGFESTPRGVVLKLYLERELSAAEKTATTPDGIPVYMAWKWSAAAGLAVLSRYHWFAMTDCAGVEHRLERIYKNALTPSAAPWISAVLQRAASRASVEQLQYLEVLEDGNSRRSFDLNLYASGFCLGDLQAELAALRDHFQLRPGYFQALFDQIKSRNIGHIAGGVHRDGAEFVTVYYGVEGFPRLVSGSIGANLTVAKPAR